MAFFELDSLRWLLLEAEPGELIPPTLLRLVLAILWLVVRSFGGIRACVLGATITSASGAIFANGAVDGRLGESDLTMMFAVDVGDRCNVKRCGRLTSAGNG